uniref:Uncharacterized protein n=1 Tax=Arundo donax TaxID=35708 RepID=A0A0A9CVP4_ARUDO
MLPTISIISILQRRDELMCICSFSSFHNLIFVSFWLTESNVVPDTA